MVTRVAGWGDQRRKTAAVTRGVFLFTQELFVDVSLDSTAELSIMMCPGVQGVRRESTVGTK